MSKEMRLMRAIGEIDDVYIDEAAPGQERKAAVRFRPWIGYAGMAAAAAVLIIGIGIVSMPGSNVPVADPVQTSGTTDEPIVMMGNPFEYYDTLEDAGAAAGFDISVPDSFGAYTGRQFAVIAGDMLEVTYYDEAGNEGLCIRKAVGTDDPSGAFYFFETVLPLTAAGKDGTMSGITRSDGTVEIYKAVWTEGGYAYSVTAPYGFGDSDASSRSLAQDEMTEIIKKVK